MPNAISIRFKLALALVPVVLLAACGPSSPTHDPKLHDQLVAAVRANSGASIDLRTVLGASWDRVAFLGPYEVNEGAQRILGVPFDVEQISPWRGTEGGALVVLALGDKIVSYFELPGSEVAVECLLGRAIAAEDAVLQVTKQADEIWLSDRTANCT